MPVWLCAASRAAAAEEEQAPKGARKVERYPPSFRLKVKQAIERFVTTD